MMEAGRTQLFHSDLGAPGSETARSGAYTWRVSPVLAFLELGQTAPSQLLCKPSPPFPAHPPGHFPAWSKFKHLAQNDG